MKKVLIITYYWPPGGGAGVQRWLKFVKYLREFGWEPIIYTPENGEMPVIDHSLEADVPENLEVIKQPIWEPYNVYKRFIGQKKEEKINTGFLSERKKPKFSEKVSVWIRGNYFIPDARKYWIKPSAKFLSKYLRENPVDAIVSTGPPHSMHLIALKLKKRFNIPWLVDFRDPWTNIDFYEDLMLTKRSDRKHRRQERAVLENADCTITIGKTLGEELKALGAKRLEVITNGFDDSDVASDNVQMDKKFSIAHIGTLVKSRNPETLWKVLEEMVNENEVFANDLEIKLVGKVDVYVMGAIQNHQLEKFLQKIDYLEHDEVTKFQRHSQVLLLLVNNTKNAKGILTGKFFEYLSARRPILAIGPEDGDLAEILKEVNAGEVCGFDDKQTLKAVIQKYYSKYKQKQLQSESVAIEIYSRRHLTKRLAVLLDELM
jgi:glycosyltransferase involved in cell wall biosynthesis